MVRLPPTPPSDRRVTVDGMEIHVRVVGEDRQGTPLLLLHGGGVDSAELSFGSVLEQIGQDRPVFAPDLPGYGQSARPDAPYSLAWYVEVIAGLADTLNLKQFDLCGLSLGGGIALGYALQHPSHVHRLVLVAPYGLTNTIPKARLSAWLIRHPAAYERLNSGALAFRFFTRMSLRQLLVNDAAITDELVSAVMAAGRDARSGRAWNAFQQSELEGLKLRTNYLRQLPDLDMPVLLMTGKQDRLVPSADVRAAGGRISRSRVVELDSCGHWLPRDQPSRFVSDLSVFLGLSSAVF